MISELEYVLSIWEKLEWRHHGAGLLQAYIDESTRIHIWDWSLVRKGMVEAGAKHNHRFAFRSLVLCGMIDNSEIVVTPDKDGSHQLWTIEGASDKANAKIVPGKIVRAVQREHSRIRVGESYATLKWEYHYARPTKDDYDVTVTYVKLFDKGGGWASLVAPRGIVPVHAMERPITNQEMASFIDSAHARLTRRLNDEIFLMKVKSGT